MIFESLKSMTWMAILLMTIFYCFSVCFTIAATDYLHSNHVSPRYSGAVKKYYGDVMKSIYTCYRSMSGGQSWGEVLDPLLHVGGLYAVIFLFYITLTIFVVLNIITAVFVEGAMIKSANDREMVVQKEINQKKAWVENLKDMFVESDTDGSGTISWEEFEAHMQNEDVRAYMDSLRVDMSNLEELFGKLDINKNGVICVEEFVENLLGLIKGRSLEGTVELLLDEVRIVSNLIQSELNMLFDS